MSEKVNAKPFYHAADLEIRDGREISELDLNEGDSANARAASVALQTQDHAVAATPPEPPSMMNFIAEALHNPNISEEKLRVLIQLQREVAADVARMQFKRALHEAQAEMPRVKKNGMIDLKEKGLMRFATWEDVDKIVRPIMQKHGFSVTFSVTAKSDQGIWWTATHRHIGGHEEQNSIPLPADSGPGRNALQAAGSTNSYAKRYLVEDFYNIVREGADDDGKKGGTVYITQDQADDLLSLLAATKADLQRFYTNFGITDLLEMERANYTVARNMLLQRQQAMKAKK